MSGPDLLVLVPAGGPDDGSVPRAAAQLRALLPDAEVRQVWLGDPELQPPGGVLPVADQGDALGEIDLVRSEQAVVEWRRVLRAVRAAFLGGAGRVLVVWPAAGAVEVHAAAGSSPEVASGAAPDVTPAARAAIDLAAFAEGGDPSVRCAGFGTRPDDAIADLDALLSASPIDVGAGSPADEDDGGCSAVAQALAALAVLRGDVVARPVGAARPPGVPERSPLGGGTGGGPGDPLRALRLPGGVEVDRTLRSAVAAALADHEEVPGPWSQPREFRRWLAARFWPARRASRLDLRAAFPDAAMREGSPFERWAAGAFLADRAPFLVDRRPDRARSWPVADALRDDGLNLVGYVRHESGLGDDVRRLARGLRAAGVGTSLLAYDRTGSPAVADPPPVEDAVTFETTLAMVTAAQFPALAADHPELFAARGRMIGYWMWEIEHVPRSFRSAFDLVDEIWTGSQFIADAFSAVTSKPVRTVTIPVPEPEPSSRERTSFPPLAEVGERPVLLVVMDHFSVTERKNPVGAIRAFRRAFPVEEAEGPVLLVKTMNARRRWDAHQRLLLEAEGRTDIHVWDAHLSRPDQMALVRACDVLVSLHRGEGLGLHLAEAMWLGVPTIATRWSGNLQFMDDDVACMVDATLVPIVHGEGIYPAHARWADPDLDVAADAMRGLVASADRRRELGRRGRERMAAQPSLAEIGRRIAELTRG